VADDQILDELRAIRRDLDGIRDELRKLNGKVARHDQTLYGIEGRGGMIDDVRNLFKVVDKFRPGWTSTKTVWAAIASIASVATVFVALVFGMQ
jgi:hypothetical protein